MTGSTRLVLAFLIAPLASAAVMLANTGIRSGDAALLALGSGICGALIAPALTASSWSFAADYSRNFNYQTLVGGLVYGASVGAAFCAIAGIGFSVPQGRIPRI